MRIDVAKKIMASAVILAFSGVAQAELNRVGPVVANDHGYPAWYQDKTGLALELCIPDASELAAGLCLVDPTFLPNPSLPDTFPTNFSDEHFWFEAGTSIPTPAGSASLGLALEAAFAGPVVAGGQMSFGRIRIRVDVPPPGGDYVITHPYGREEFPDVKPGRRMINFTEDIGITCPVGDFSCALRSRIGPFLRPSLEPGGKALAPVVINEKTYLSDPAVPTFVTGSPFNTNVFRIEGPNIGGPGINVIESTQFNVMGRVHTERIPSPLAVERATYSRNAKEARIAVFATSDAGIEGAPPPLLSISGTNVPSTQMAKDSNRFFGQVALTDPRSLPATLLVTNSGDNPPSSVDANLVDEVRVTQAHYNPLTSTLKIAAGSSDQMSQPDLVAEGYGQLSNGVLLVQGVSVPPPSIQVTSAAGGMNSATVSISKGAVAVNDTAITLESQPVTINVLANDSDVDVATVRITTLPANGTINVDAGSGAITYTPRKYYIGNDQFSYVAKGLDGVESNSANVAVTIQQRRR